MTLPTSARYADALDYPLLHRGKVRELYAYDDERLLMVATDQISAFDFVLDSLIPDKGAVLTQLSQWWFAQLTDLVENHVLSTDVPAPVRVGPSSASGCRWFRSSASPAVISPARAGWSTSRRNRSAGWRCRRAP